MSVYSSNNYRSFIAKAVAESKKKPKPLTFKALAHAARIQAPYLTKVIQGRADLSQDQAHLIAECMGLSDDEEIFFSLLVEYERSAVSERKQKIKRQIERLRDRSLKIQRVVKAKSETALTPATARYHLDVQCLTIHMALTVPAYSKQPKKICEAMGISLERLDLILKTLAEQDLIKWESDGSVKVIKEHLHLPDESPLFQARQAQLRAAGSYRAATTDDPFNHSFQVMFSADANTATEIKMILNESLERIEGLAKDARAEGVYQFGFDLLKWI